MQKSRINQLLSESIEFSKNDIIDIFTKAITILNAEQKYNFNAERHKNMFIKNAINEGCGCEYCKLRYKLRNLNLSKHRDKKFLDRMWEVLTLEEKREGNKKILQLKDKIKTIKDFKTEIKKELGLI